MSEPAPLAPIPRLASVGVTQLSPAPPVRPYPWFALCAPCALPTPKTPFAHAPDIGSPTAGSSRPAGARADAAKPGATRPAPAAPLYAVHFPFGSAELSPPERDQLRAMASVLRGATLRLLGYTDSAGSKALNDRLARQRAEAVRHFLVATGLAPERLRAEGHGRCCYVASNTTPAGRAANRRVEIRPAESSSNPGAPGTPPPGHAPSVHSTQGEK